MMKPLHTRDGGETREPAGQTLWAIRENGLAVSPHDPNALCAINDLGELWVYREPDAAPEQIPYAGRRGEPSELASVADQRDCVARHIRD